MENLNNELYTHPIALYKLNKSERSVISKLRKNGIYSNRAIDIISLDDNSLDKYKDLLLNEPSLKTSIISLKEKILNTPDCIRKYIAPISFSSMQRELIEVLNYKGSLKRKEQDMFDIFVYGKNDIKTYAHVKESSMQKHKNSLYKELRTVLFYNTSRYRNYLKNNNTVDIKLEMPELYSKFQNDNFYNFIKNMFDFDDDFKFQTNAVDDIDINECFDDIFQEIALPCSLQAFRNSFYEIVGLNYVQINELMPKIEAQGLVVVKDKKVMSAKLQFKTAVIQVLLQSSHEMNWNEILNEIRQKSYFDGEPQSKQEFEDSLGLYGSIIKTSCDSYIHVRNSNLTIDIIDKCIDIIASERKHNSMITANELQAKINMPISIFEIEHILSKIDK